VFSPESIANDRQANPRVTAARLDRDRALATFAEYMTRVGQSAPWVDADPVEEWSDDESPPFYLD
jgi:hypothetical protein